MIRPPFLKPNDKIALAAPARKIAPDEIIESIRVFESWGLNVVYDERLFLTDNQFGGTDIERLKYFQDLLDRSDIKAIISVRGGYGITRIIDDIDFTFFKKNPKWICGYSDVTALLNHVFNLQIESIHSTMPMLFQRDTDESLISLKKLLFGEAHSISVPYNALNVKGEAEGLLIGGNLSILNTIISTPSDVDFSDKILFLEDIDEYLYNIDRMMVHFKRAGKLKKLKGVVVGHMTDMKDNSVPFGLSACEIILQYLKGLDIPVAFGLPIGHEPQNIAIPFGRLSKLRVSNSGSDLTFS